MFWPLRLLLISEIEKFVWKNNLLNIYYPNQHINVIQTKYNSFKNQSTHRIVCMHQIWREINVQVFALKAISKRKVGQIKFSKWFHQDFRFGQILSRFINELADCRSVCPCVCVRELKRTTAVTKVLDQPDFVPNASTSVHM